MTLFAVLAWDFMPRLQTGYCSLLIVHLHNDIIIDDVLSKRLFVGFDHIGNALEIIAIDDNEQDRLVVIYAMKLRKQFFHLLLSEENNGL